MKKIIVLAVLLITTAFTGGAKAAGDTAVFSATSDKSSYKVGDEIKVSLNVDAGSYASTLSVIDFKVKLSDTSVAEPSSNTPLTLGNIYTNSVTQSYTDGIISAVVFVDPNNKPAQRSGVIGTITLKANKVGKSTISYDNIQATEENNELSYITTSASSLVINIEPTVIAEGSQTAIADTTAATASVATRTATPQPGRATTGPKEVIAIAVLAGILLLIGLKLYKKININAGKI